MLSEILAGRQSPLSQDVLLYGTADRKPEWGQAQPRINKDALVSHEVTATFGNSEGLDHCDGLRSWLALGLHPLKDLADEGVPLCPTNEALLETGRTLPEATTLLMRALLAKAEDLGATTLVVPIDSMLLVEFMFEVIGPEGFGLGSGTQDSRRRFGTQAPPDQELCLHFVAEELMRCCADLWSGHQSHLVFLCETTSRLETMITLSRSAKSKVTSEHGMYVRI